MRNAQGAGLQVSTYAFSHYTNDEEARAEARYYAAFANRLGLPKNTVMVNDMEDPKMQNGINQHTQAWADKIRRLGLSRLTELKISTFTHLASHPCIQLSPMIEIGRASCRERV